MATAIAVYNSEGLVGRCDASCHNATKPECDCICGGRLHGVGASRAIEENTRHWLGDELRDELVALAERTGCDPSELHAVTFAPDTLFALDEASQ